MALPFGAHVPFSAHNPSPLSFGFGLGVPQHHLPPPPNDFDAMFIQSHNPAASPSQPQLQSSRPVLNVEVGATPQRTSEKRRRQVDEQEDDAAMERSPSPADRPVRKLGAKKLRQTPLARSSSGVGMSENRNGPQDGEDDVDVGSLLASLPPSSLLPLLTSLVEKKPELKPIILSLIPRPTLETAIHALSEGARRLREAYPYSLPSNNNHNAASAGFGFGSSSSTAGNSVQPAGMRESYIRTRLRQPVRDFTKLFLSYMSYFSSTPTITSTVNTNAGGSTQSSVVGLGAEPLQKQPPTVPLHPTETFTFLHALTLQLLRLPPLTLAEFARPSENIVFPRLQAEWTAWIQKIDDDVNKWGGMYRDEVVKGWERGLDELLTAEESAVQQQNQPGVVSASTGGYIGIKAIRNSWVQRVGWLIGRRTTGSMGMEM
ncbi:hypothetical protein FRB96_006342 [Tulasnella sp. 330]|nr:hypothetical protein FRB96_006342 [Tulasnella sp. 330]KAG8884248.1 hypothetical protein FRB97_004753 [Tulasnella sp. 331]